jgi:hypothetical protein
MSKQQCNLEQAVIEQMDIDYFKKKLDSLHPLNVEIRTKIEKQIALLEDAIVVYRLQTPPRE